MMLGFNAYLSEHSKPIQTCKTDPRRRSSPTVLGPEECRPSSNGNADLQGHMAFGSVQCNRRLKHFCIKLTLCFRLVWIKTLHSHAIH